jgi:adenosylmethionine-8-amino-7-oxononanoate aminotransferase
VPRPGGFRKVGGVATQPFELLGYESVDRHFLWHPYTRHSATRAGNLPIITRGEGVYLYDAQDRRYLDAISSWWACSLGHGHPRIVEAIRRQAGELQHSILGNLSHPRAIELASRLAGLMPDATSHVLFASDGSSAVEAALKIALQYAHQAGRPERTRVAALENGYHGDTLGAVSAGYLEAFHRPFKNLLQPALTAPAPSRSRDTFPDMERLVEAHAGTLAAIIVEPLCQGAAGMNMYPPEYLARLAALCRAQDILLIVDEIAMGFGRTGTMWAFEQAGITPDIVCAGKAMSAGYLPISATLVRDSIYQAFSDEPVDHTFYHGHTFSGNPIAAAAAVETLKVYAEERVLDQAARGARRLAGRMPALAGLAGVKEVRCLGMIGVVELAPAGDRPRRIQQYLRERGILLRPLGDVVYLMPPLITPDAVLDELVDALADALRATS